MPQPERPREMRQSIPPEIELEFPVGAEMTHEETGTDFRISAFDYQYGWVIVEVDEKGISKPEQIKLVADMKKEEKGVIKKSKDFITDEPLNEKQIKGWERWSRENPSRIILNAQWLEREAREVVREVHEGDHYDYYDMQLIDPKTGKVISIVDSLAKERKFRTMDQMGREGEITPEEIFASYSPVETGIRVPMPGDVWFDPKTVASRMEEPVIVRVNYTNPTRGEVNYTDDSTKKEVTLPHDQFVEKFKYWAR